MICSGKRFAAVALLALACQKEQKPDPEATPSARTEPATAPSPMASSAPAASSSSSPTQPASAPKPVGPCGADMVLVEGKFCPEVEQKCLQHMKDYEEEEEERERKKDRGETVGPMKTPERCVRFEKPTKCLSKERLPMRFCIDRHEWPNKEGELPFLLTTWKQATELCAGIGKRLCTRNEFTFACEGEEGLPYSYGYERDATRCAVDKPYIKPKRKFSPYDHCMSIKTCKMDLEEIDQRVPIGSSPNCTSPFGAFDLNGNVNEWVTRPGQEHPWRSGLMGGWWGAARARCRPMVIAHNENYAGYEVGFRCCKDLP
jgi:sulfatase modifying factor 1